MPASDFFERVWDAVEQIPPGRVSTYGHLARHLGVGRSARTIGWALKAAAATGVPCHRVVNRAGALTGRLHFESPTVMEERLRSEGVAFLADGCVDLPQHLWDPARPDLDAAELSVGIGK
jgi:O-6-methylguanine DNA methyltransferase